MGRKNAAVPAPADRHYPTLSRLDQFRHRFLIAIISGDLEDTARDKHEKCIEDLQLKEEFAPRQPRIRGRMRVEWVAEWARNSQAGIGDVKLSQDARDQPPSRTRLRHPVSNASKGTSAAQLPFRERTMRGIPTAGTQRDGCKIHRRITGNWQ